jgi:hypothetical protein
MSCDFSHAHYRDALRKAAEGYAFAAFDAAPAGRPFLLLRHDVDFSLEWALPLARIEAELGVRSTYFVLPHGPENLLGEPGFSRLREILGLGHRLGLHYDLGFYAACGLPPLETLRREAALLEDRFATPVRVAAEHNPGRVPRPAGLDLAPLLDAYAPAFTRNARYLSDSCQSWREGCFCAHLGPARQPRLQVLVHPIWWSQDARPADAALRGETARRIDAARADAARVLDHYAGLEHLPNRELFRRGRS